jgi:hypothetical protein
MSVLLDPRFWLIEMELAGFILWLLAMWMEML